MKITLNLATRPYADQGPALKRLRIGMAVLAGLLVLLGLGMLHFHQAAVAMAAREEVLDQSINQIEREQQGYQVQMQQPPNAKVLTQAQFLNGLFEEKSFSWTAAMEDLERVLPAGVQVTAIEPSRGKDGRLTLKLRVSGQRERSVEMVRNMERSQRFANPRVSGENAENAAGQGSLQPVQDSGRVSFDVLAEYNPATLEERRAEIGAQKHKTLSAKPATKPQKQQYVPPNPQPGRPARQGQSPAQAPGAPPQNMGPVRRQNHVPAANPNGNRGGIQAPGEDNPSGYDPNGLKNHDRNRIPSPGYPSPGYPQPNPTQGDPK